MKVHTSAVNSPLHIYGLWILNQIFFCIYYVQNYFLNQFLNLNQKAISWIFRGVDMDKNLNLNWSYMYVA